MWQSRYTSIHLEVASWCGRGSGVMLVSPEELNRAPRFLSGPCPFSSPAIDGLIVHRHGRATIHSTGCIHATHDGRGEGEKQKTNMAAVP